MKVVDVSGNFRFFGGDVGDFCCAAFGTERNSCDIERIAAFFVALDYQGVDVGKGFFDIDVFEVDDCLSGFVGDGAVGRPHRVGIVELGHYLKEIAGETVEVGLREVDVHIALSVVVVECSFEDEEARPIVDLAETAPYCALRHHEAVVAYRCFCERKVAAKFEAVFFEPCEHVGGDVGAEFLFFGGVAGIVFS